jgi:hypothetical protein
VLVHIWKLTAAQRIKGSLDNNTEGDLAGDLEVTWLAEEGESGLIRGAPQQVFYGRKAILTCLCLVRV